MAAIQASYPEKDIHDDISDYYIAEKMASTDEGMNLILEPEDWAIFMTAKIPDIGEVLLYLTKKIDLRNINVVLKTHHLQKMNTKENLMFLLQNYCLNEIESP